MAKSPKVNVSLLRFIADGEKTTGYAFLSEADGYPLVSHNPPLIDVNMGITDGNKAAARLTEAGRSYLDKALKKSKANQPTETNEGEAKMEFQVISGWKLPEPKRGKPAGAGGTSKYPFADLQPGTGFFVADGEKPAAKTLGALVSNFNMKGAEPTGETKTVKQARRDPADKTKFLLGPDGKKIYDCLLYTSPSPRD